MSAAIMRAPSSARRCDPAALTQRRMASLKKTKVRITASENIHKITSAMKNVASARMKSAEKEAKASANFYVGLNNYFSELPMDSFGTTQGKHVVMPITSDRGLCGAVNSNVIRMLRKDTAGMKDLEVNVVGSKGKDQLLRTHGKQLNTVYDEMQKKPPSFSQICGVADDVLSRDFDTMSIYYTKFNNTASLVPSRMDMFSPSKVEELSASLDEYECEPEKNEMMDAMYQFYFASNLYYAVTTSLASEMASRMVAMTGASTNAKDMITKLKILYNRTRQAIITGQLIEIVSASEAISE